MLRMATRVRKNIYDLIFQSKYLCVDESFEEIFAALTSKLDYLLSIPLINSCIKV